VGGLQQLLQAVANLHFHRVMARCLQFATIQVDAVIRAGNQVWAGIQPQSIETALLGFIEHFFQRRKSTVTSVTVQQPGQIPAGHRQGLCAILLCHPGPAPVSD
jgi:hypothetical protein